MLRDWRDAKPKCHHGTLSGKLAHAVELVSFVREEHLFEAR